MATKKIFNQKSPMLQSRSSGGLLPWMGVAVIVILCDQLSKITITRLLLEGQQKVITGWFNLVLMYNYGAAFSFLDVKGGMQRYLFTGIGVIAAAAIIYMLRRHAGQRLFCWSLSMILGGALGNVIDRVLYGHVIDFLDFHLEGWGHFPAFNIADSAITVGAILFIIDELRRVNKH